MKTRLGGRTWAALLTFGLFGQIAWVIENMYFNVFLYNTISGDTSMIAAMVAWSAVTATVTTLVMGALSDRLGRRKALIVIGYLLWGVSIGAFAFIKRSPLAGAAHSAAVLVVVMDCVMTFFGSTANDAAFNAWVTDVTVPENRGRVETVLAIMPLVAMLVVFGALDGLTQAGNWRLFFLIVGGITCLGGVLGCEHTAAVQMLELRVAPDTGQHDEGREQGGENQNGPFLLHGDASPCRCAKNKVYYSITNRAKKGEG